MFYIPFTLYHQQLTCYICFSFQGTEPGTPPLTPKKEENLVTPTDLPKTENEKMEEEISAQLDGEVQYMYVCACLCVLDAVEVHVSMCLSVCV